MAGSNTAQKELVYSKTAKSKITLNLYAVNGKRDYSQYVNEDGESLITSDKLFLLEIVDSEGNSSALYPFCTYDIGECAHRVISNKVLPIARQREADKIIKRIQEALNRGIKG